MKIFQKHSAVFLRVLGIVAAVEIAVMMIIQALPIPPGIWTVLVDGVLLTLICAPLLYLGLIRGLNREIEGRRQAEKAAKKGLDFISSVIDTTDSLVMVIERSGRIVRFSRACEKTTGFLADEVAGKQAWDLFLFASEAEEAESVCSRLQPGHIVESHEYFWKTRDADRRLIRWTFTLLRNDPGEVEHVVATGIDITEEKNAEERLIKAAREWALTFDSMVDGVSIHSTDYDIINVNSVLCDMLGATREELIGKKCHEVFHLKDRPIAECPLARTKHSQHREYAEIFEEAIGNGIWLSVATAPMIDENGEIKNIIHVVRDITERKKAEAALAEAHHRNELILNNAGEGIYGMDTEGRVTFINPAAASMLGYEPAAVIGRPGHALWHHSKADGTPYTIDECAIYSSARTGIAHSIADDIYWKANGVSFPVEYASSGIMDQGKCVGAVVIFRDVTEKREAERQIRHQMENLAALHEIDLAITASIDLRIILKVILTQVVEQLEVDAADILLLDPRLNTLEFAEARGFRTEPDRYSTLSVNQSVAGRAILERRIASIANIERAEDNIARAPLFHKEGFVTYHAIPLLVKGQVKGVLEVFHRKRFFPDEKWKDFFKTVATQTAIAIDNAGLFGDLQRTNNELVLAYDKTLEGWSRAMDLRDKETEGHTRRVSELTLHLGRAMGISDAELVHLYRGALLHDVGKLGIPDSILLKPGKLTEDEWKIMKLHPRYAYELLSPISYLRPAVDIPYCHHEMWDGSGYPRGLRGEQIPLPARIFALIDVWDALRSDRPYRPAWPEEKVREHISSLSDTHFDPQVVETFLKMDLQNAM